MEAPEWIKVLPAGEFEGRDGRRFKNPYPHSLIETTKSLNFEAGWAIDFNHQTDFSTDGGPAPAAGWMTNFQVRNGSIWARVEWTEKGRQAVASKEYRYISPVFTVDDETGEVLQLLRAGLTNSPNLYGTAICEKVALNVAIIPIVTHQQERAVLSDTEKLIIGRFRGVSEKAFAAFSARGSEPFAPSRERDDGIDPKLVAPKGADDGRGGRRAEEAPRGRIELPEKDRPARLDDGKDGEDDPIMEATKHLLAGPGHENEGGAEDVCSGEGCQVDHEMRAHEILRKHLSMREGLPHSNGIVRFQR